MSFQGRTIQNTNELLRRGAHFFYGADGFRTGTTREAGWCLAATAERDGRRVISIVMAAGGHDRRYVDTRLLLDFGFSELARRDSLIDGISAELTTNVDTVRRNTSVTVTARLESVDSFDFSVPGGNWTVNGRTVATFGPFTPAHQRSLTLTHLLPADSAAEALDIGFTLNLPDGTVRTAALTLPVSDQPPALFRDIHGHWAEAHVERAVGLGLFSGVNADQFMPNGDMTRAMFVTVLGRLATRMGIDLSTSAPAPFGDVSAGRFYSPYVAWAFEQGIVRGVSDTQFGPNHVVTRQEVATFFHRFMQHYEFELPGERTMSFPDADLVSGFAREAMAEAVRTGLITGYADGRLAPRNTATRAQVAVIFLRFVDASGAVLTGLGEE